MIKYKVKTITEERKQTQDKQKTKYKKPLANGVHPKSWTKI